ncbi:flagellar hook-basal body complex protein FliE [Propionivibrio limicola]|uniref:flagellar hook-basal body complex protein FliE n=1 Tax=Propionivibrio limicola TaxID=167645 RepID=UPI0012921457|nr:flagellar hook-basal body complex protein FliE [Propionivibrio limicola]
MDTKGIDQMLSMMRATAAQASGRAQAPASSSASSGSVDFAQVLQNSIQQVNQTQQEAESLSANFAAGDTKADLHEVMLSLQKADLSFQEMVQVRNKLVSAYNDVMNMQV